MSDLLDTSDPRAGSATANATGGTLSKLNPSSKDSSSFSALVSTLVPVLVYSAVCLSIFWILRNKFPRVYSPRTILTSFLPQERSLPLPTHILKWVRDFFKIEDTFALQHISLDAYLFLRYLKILAMLCFTGVCITWPVLMPIHSRGKAGLTQLDSLTIGNVTSKNAFFVHAAVCWVYFSIILYTIFRECIFYINLRHAYLFSRYQSSRLSSRTVLFISVPARYRDQARLRKLFGDEVMNVWIPRDTSDLEKLVKEREETALRLEKAEIALIKLANKLRKKQLGEQSPQNIQELNPQPSLEINTLASQNEAVKLETKQQTSGTIAELSADSPPSTANTINNPVTEDGKHVVTATVEPEPTNVQFGFEAQVTNEQALQPPTQSSPSHTEQHQPPAHQQMQSQSPQSQAELQAQSQSQPQLQIHPVTNLPLDPNADTEAGRRGVPDVSGSVAGQWVPAEMRPSHRPLANFFRRVDTIKWTRNRLRVLNPRIRKMRKQLLAGDGKALASVFVEFRDQAAAEKAYQTLAHHLPSHMSTRYIGLTPDDIVWSALNYSWLSLLVRRFGMFGVIFLGIVFWSIPSAMVGAISNIESLARYLPPLKFILHFPASVKGVIQGFLPALMLSLLMAIVPFLLRKAARIAGTPSLSLIELFVQRAYFPFQVVQVFLITTISSAASAALMQVIKAPFSAASLLSENLPKASNFYISYILVQCLAAGAGALVHLVDLFRHQVLARNMDHPRSAFKVWHNVRPVHWGAIFPVFTNMGVIAFSYCCIAPLILIFAACGIYIIYLSYRYNLMFTYNSKINCRGLVYPTALMQLLIGLYLAEICMIGLLALRTALIPMVLMIMYLGFTALCHFTMSSAIKPLLYNLPQSLAVESSEAHTTGAEFRVGGDEFIPSVEGQTTTVNPRGNVPPVDVNDGYVVPTHESHLDPADGKIGDRGLEGADRFVTSIFALLKEKAVGEATAAIEKTPIGPISAYIRFWISPPRHIEPNFILRWLHPEVFDDFQAMTKMLAPEVPDEMLPANTYPPDYTNRAYWPPAMSARPMHLWIPRDEAGVSRQEVEHTSKVVAISDEGAELLPNGRIYADIEKAPFVEERVVY
ncbi:hypothetical protein TD95_003830 [Thielaviopsis punctulata]|uniref:DUF221-domain-containing protein n=1 Tax=Thielaviopsis punctulata TaxID=72032 RepID=A0A0F4ZIR2_9PEZI|nr:hypothetical protein TD95_003830 [Thielaviopsis punctulata]